MADGTPRKPGNRPSRRQDLIDAAVELFSLQSWDLVTVADIVERAGMTSAAFYYHFSSREQLLEEVVEKFCEHWVTTIEALLDAAEDLDRIGQIPTALIENIDRSQRDARIFFLSASTAPLLVERIHRRARHRVASAATAAIRRIAHDRSEAVATVNGLAMMCLYEMAVQVHLAVDEPYRVLGPRRFRTQVAALSELTTGDYQPVRPSAPRPRRRRT
jgi:AcrR family transcriptional regulator